MMEINAIIILCACTIGLSLLCPQAHFSPACQRMLGTGGLGGWGQGEWMGPHDRTLLISFPSLPPRRCGTLSKEEDGRQQINRCQGSS